MNKNIENILVTLDNLRMNNEMTYSVYSTLHDEISLLDNLLKEQEPVTWSYKYNCFICSNCGLSIKDEVHYLMNKPISFCPTCGRKVKWDD